MVQPHRQYEFSIMCRSRCGAAPFFGRSPLNPEALAKLRKKCARKLTRVPWARNKASRKFASTAHMANRASINKRWRAATGKTGHYWTRTV